MIQKFLLLCLFYTVKSDKSCCEFEVVRALENIFAPQNTPPSPQIQSLRSNILHYIQNSPKHYGQDSNNEPYKRSLAILAKNGQLPHRLPNEKRGIESLARNGELNVYRHRLRDNNDDNYGKRNEADDELFGLNLSNPKRNSLIHLLLNPPRTEPLALGSKRQNDYPNDDYLPLFYQNQNGDHLKELIKALEETSADINKRFLGRLPQMGKSTTSRPTTRFRQ